MTMNDHKQSLPIQSSDQSSSSSTGSSPSLCGYLNQLNGVGPLKGFKRRWFVYSPPNCKLYYYRVRDDILPLGEIDIRRATFALAYPNKNPNVFTILSFDKEFTLEASDRNNCLFWLRQLQKLRRNYIVDLADKFGVKLAKYDESNYSEIANDESSETSMNSVFYDNDDADCDKSSVNSGKIKNEDLVVLTTHSPATKRRMFTNVINKIKRNDSSNSGIQQLSPLRLRKDKRESKCPKCKEMEEQFVSLSDDMSAVENELQASREVIKLLQKQLEISNNENHILQEICKKGSNLPSDDYLTILSRNNEEMTKLQIMLRQSQLEKDGLKNEHERCNNENVKMKEEISVLQELLQSRDQTVVSLTNEIFDMETEKRRQSQSGNDTVVNVRNSKRNEITEVQSLRDTIRAFEQQNEFLNREIVELNELRNVVEMKERESQLKICELEAKCCQIQSKLLSLLKEINQSNRGTTNDANDTVIALVNRLLDDLSLDIPLSWRPGNRPRTTSEFSISKNGDCDELGFYYKSDVDSDALDVLASKAETMRIKSEETRDVQETKSLYQWKSKWDSFVGNLSNHPFQRTQELKCMIRTGIPQEYRCKIWKGMIYSRLKGNNYAQLGHDYGQYYQSLLKQNPTPGTKCDPSAKQIELDLLRTLPNNRHFESLDSDGTCRLRRVLTAYSRHNPIVGYCQGLNRLAAVALLFMPEEDAFWCLVAIVETIMPEDYYGRNLLGAHVDQYVLRHLLSEKLPRLNGHFELHGIELSLFSWFLTAFVDNIPVKVYLRIWDVFLYEGNKVLFRFALAFLKLHEEEILKMNDSVSINQFLRTLGERPCDVKQLCTIAFLELNPFPYRTVKTKRAYHTTLVENELQKLEEIRKSLPHHDRSYDSQSD